MIAITDQEVSEFIKKIEKAQAGFTLDTFEDVFQELISRRRLREAGVGAELLPKTWPVLCEHFGGLGTEELMVLTGETGRGKTTFFLRYMLSLLSQGHKGLAISLEGGYSTFCKRLGEMVLEIPEKEWDMGNIGSFKEITSKFGELYTYRPTGTEFSVPQERILNAMRYAVLKHGVQFVVLDHLGFVKMETSHGITSAEAIGNFLKMIKIFNDRYSVPVLLIAHPAKAETKGYKVREIGMDELKGSSDIKQLADTVVSLFPMDDEGVTGVRFQKIRNSDHARHTGRGITFTYNHERSTLSEACSYPQVFERN